MNWYPRYYGDYMRDTAHLSLAEHGAYAVLLDHYYATDKPLLEDATAAYRICRAFAEEERESVDSVLRQFFPIIKGERRNNRADIELKKQRDISAKRSVAGSKRPGTSVNQKTKQLLNKSIHKLQPQVTPTKEQPLPPKAGRGFVEPDSTGVGIYIKEYHGIKTGGVYSELDTNAMAEGFVDFYASKGWLVGKSKMKDWRAAARRWYKSNQQEQGNGRKNTTASTHLGNTPDIYAELVGTGD